MTERYIQHLPQFRVYNREQELARREREQKESAWEQELLQAMRASDPTGSQLTSSDDHEVSTSITSSDITVGTHRADSLHTNTRSSENRKQQESKSRTGTGTVAPTVDQTVRTRVVSNVMRGDEIGRRYSDQSNKGTCTKVLPLVRNKSEVAASEDHMPQEAVNQRKYDVLGKKLCKAGEHDSGREQEHCKSCPKLFPTEQSTSSSHLSPKSLCCGQDVREENVTCKSQQRDCRMLKSAVSYSKCQVTEKTVSIPHPYLDNSHQNQSLTCNIQTQMSETKESVKEQYNVKEHTIENNMLIHGASIDHSLSQYQCSSTVRNQNLDCNKPGSSKSHLEST
jgi:hypothetical protein